MQIEAEKRDAEIRNREERIQLLHRSASGQVVLLREVELGDVKDEVLASRILLKRYARLHAGTEKADTTEATLTAQEPAAPLLATYELRVDSRTATETHAPTTWIVCAAVGAAPADLAAAAQTAPIWWAATAAPLARAAINKLPQLPE